MLELWWAYRTFIGNRQRFMNPVSFLSLTGMILGVAALIVVMSVVSGFQTTLTSAVTDITGHLLIIKRGEPLDKLEVLLPKMKKIVPDIVAATPFVQVEGMVATKGKISGVVVQGLDLQTSDQALDLKHRLVEGTYNLRSLPNEISPAVIGKGLKDKMSINVGDVVSIVLPKNSPGVKKTGFVPQIKKFKIVGVVNLGMYDYDSRYVLTSSSGAQQLAGIGPFFTGLRVKIKDEKQAGRASFDLSSELGYQYLVRDWMESHYNLLTAIEHEKVVIFIVLLSITIAACFNIASTLFISVIRKTQDIAIMKAFGTSSMRILRFFSLQGMFLGIGGSLLGLILGLSLCFILTHTNIFYVPPEIYHLSHLPVEIRWFDIMTIMGACLTLCFISTLAPALKAARMIPVQGLRQ